MKILFKICALNLFIVLSSPAFADPKISEINPSCVNPGEEVNIQGRGLSARNAVVTVNNIRAEILRATGRDIKKATGNSITFRTPFEAKPGITTVTLINPDGLMDSAELQVKGPEVCSNNIDDDCDGIIDEPRECPSVLIPIKLSEEETAQLGSNLTGIKATDYLDNEIRILIPGIYLPEGITIKQGVDFGEISYQYVTNKIIEINFPQDLTGKQLVIITPSQPFEYVYQFDPENKKMIRMPFVVEDNEAVKIRPTPINGTVYVALVFR